MGERLARTAYVGCLIEEGADLSSLQRRPSTRLLVGLTLIGLSFVVGGWPTIALIGVVAAYLGEPLVFIIGGPAAYGASWLVWGAGILLAGRESLKDGKVFFRWLVRITVLRMMGQRAGAK